MIPSDPRIYPGYPRILDDVFGTQSGHSSKSGECSEFRIGVISLGFGEWLRERDRVPRRNAVDWSIGRIQWVLYTVGIDVLWREANLSYRAQ